MQLPQPWYRRSKSAWYVQVDNQQHRFAKGPEDATEKAARTAFYQPMAALPQATLQALSTRSGGEIVPADY